MPQPPISLQSPDASSAPVPPFSPSSEQEASSFAWRLVKSLLKIAAVLILLAVVGVTTLFALLSREHRTPMALPMPTGHFAVGRTTQAWVNDAETEESDPSLGAKRVVIAWIWYPATGATAATRAEYLPVEWRAAVTATTGKLMGQYLTRDLALVQAHSTADPEVSSEQRSFPVVILRAGGGALTTDFTTLAEDLASHGYFVVGFDAPYRTFVVVLPDGRIVTRPPSNDPENLSADEQARLISRLLPMWTDDTKFVVNQLQKLNAGELSGGAEEGKFAGRLDMRRLGMFGHSFGGATALQFCHDDPRCKAGADIDGAPYGSVVQEGLKQPFLFILSDHSHDPADPAAPQIRANFQSIYDRLRNGRLFLTIRGANHFSFSDQILLKSQYLIGLMRRAGFGTLDGRRGLAITAEYLHTFFDVYLKDAPTESLERLSHAYPEVQVDK